MVTAAATVDPATRTVSLACVFEGLLARERFVLSSLYDRLPRLAGMVPGTRTTRRLDLGATDRDDLAPLVDLNFGCPAKGALRGCAGAALLDEPSKVEAIVSTLRKAIGEDVPLSAKIRAGGEDDAHTEDLRARFDH